MSQFKGSLFFLLSCIFFSSCSVELRDKAGAKDDVPPSPAPTQTSRQTAGIGAQDLIPQLQIPMKGPHYQILEGAGFNTYRVQVSPPANTKTIERTNIQTLEKTRLWLPNTAWVDDATVAGGHYQYRFLSASGEVLGETLVTVPLDMVLAGPVSVKSLKLGRPLRRLLLTADSLLKVGSEGIELKAETILVEPGARIETFPAGTKASAAKESGASGGQVRLVALTAQGHLVAEMRGVDGQDGLVGQPYPEPAAAGASYPETITGRGQCENLKKGGDGHKGLTGRQGEDGGTGGNTGSLIINVLNDQDLQVDVRWSPGKGGRPGEGGPGQLGGAAGVSEVRKIVSRLRGADAGQENESICPTIPDGIRGEDGPMGRPGTPGRDGIQGVFCRRSQQESCQ